MGPLAEGQSTPGSCDEPMLRAWMQDERRRRRRATTTGRAAGSPSRAGPVARIAHAPPASSRATAWPSRAGDGVAAHPLAADHVGVACGRVVPLRHRRRRRRLADATSATTTARRWSSTRRRSSERVEILGAPVVELELAVDQPRALVAARLSDVAPDGASTRVTYGVLNLTHRDGHEHPTPLEPGAATYRVRARAPRDRARLPGRPPDPARALDRLLADRLARARPVDADDPRGGQRAAAAGAAAATREDAALAAFAPVETAPPTPTTVLRPPRIERFARSDEATGETDYAILRDDGAVRIEATGTVIETRKDLRYRVHASDPDRTRAEADVVYAMSRADWRPRLVSRGVLTGDAGHFRLHTTLDAYDGDTRVFSRSWSQRIARDHV